jgi:hypothetical protein
LLELVLITVAFLCVVSVIRSQAAVRVLCSLLVLASSTCVWGPAARAIYPRAQLVQATDAAPKQLAQIVPAVPSSFSVLEFPDDFLAGNLFRPWFAQL